MITSRQYHTNSCWRRRLKLWNEWSTCMWQVRSQSFMWQKLTWKNPAIFQGSFLHQNPKKFLTSFTRWRGILHTGLLNSQLTSTLSCLLFYIIYLRVQYSNWPALQCIQFATVLANKGKGLRGQLRFGGISDQLCKCWLLNVPAFNLISQIMSWQSASLSWKVSQKMCALMDLDLKAMTCFQGRIDLNYLNFSLFIMTVRGPLPWMTRFSSRKLWKSLERYIFL